MKRNGHPHLSDALITGVPQRDTTGKLGRPGAKATIFGTLDDDRVSAHQHSHQSPACLRMLRSSPGGKVQISRGHVGADHIIAEHR